MEEPSRSQFTQRSLFAEFARFGLGNALSAATALIAGAALRLWMLGKFFEVNGDSQIYGGLAKNLLLHGRYAISDGSGVLHETLIRLPGYPFFLALCFRLFGMENYFSAAVAQIGLELAGCVLLALTAARVCPAGWAQETKRRAGMVALWLACLCPFTAIFTAAPLTEALTGFSIALALWALARFEQRRTWGSALGFTFAITYATLLRPDGALVGVALAGAMLLAARQRLRMVSACLLLALAPFGAWAVRNWQVLHVVQPLAPRYATDPGEPTYPGFQAWMKTWCLDFNSTYEIYWNVPDGPIDLGKLPRRAFDSPAQYAETAAMVREYEANGEDLTDTLDARFAKLAAERVEEHPLRSHVLLPLGRVADMLFRPRIENLPIDRDWWVYAHHRVETRFSWFYAGLNALYFLLGAVGLWLRPRLWPWMLAYFVLRCALLATVEAPEARYTIEFFPMLFVLGGVAAARVTSDRKRWTAETD